MNLSEFHPQPKLVTKETAVQLTYQLRDAGIGTRLAFARNRRSMKSQMREANKHDIQYVIILGESEVVEQMATIRPLAGGDQIQVPFAQLIDWLQQA